MTPPHSRQPVQGETTDVKMVDQEWIELLILARNIGITPDEIRNFLQQSE